MSQQNPTIIVGHLDDSELTKSIDKLVNEVANKTTVMAGKFETAIDKMKFAMKDFAVTQKVSVDLMKEAWRDMSKSFDAMVAAQEGATRGGSGKGRAGGGSTKVYAPDTVGALEQEIALEKEKRREMLLGSVELDRQNILLEKRRKLLKEETSSPYQKIEKSFSKEFGAANSMSAKTLQQAEDKLKRLIDLQNKFKGTGLIDETKMNRLQKAIDGVTDKITKLRNAKPKSLKEVLGMDASSLDAIQAKMKAIANFRLHVNADAHPQLIQRLNLEYDELHKKQLRLMGQNSILARSNNYLAQSFGYIRNRIVYALTLGALTNFIKQLYEVRGQYELLERSLGVLVGSFEKGTQIFNELNEMAIKSPFTLIELGTAAKQLTAYNFAANEVVDTTRRLADISAALGVPMERLTYNLGQIKAQGVLNARDARDFANAGLAIVPMLAKMYTEQKTFGDEMVTTAQVYDMMSKKMVTYSDVLKVLYKVTDEGGKFFDFQAKQADTLRVQMANLTLAYNNMLNEIGAENQGILSGMVGGLRTLLKNWREISRAILTLVTTLGTYKAVATIVSALNSRMFVGGVLVNLRNYILGIKNATGAMATFNAVTRANPIAFLISALVAAIGYFALFNHKVKETTVEMERFGENASKQIKKVETLGKVLAGVEEGSSTYKKALSDLNQIVSEYGVTEIKNRDEINSKIQQTIQLIKEEGKERQYANNIAKGEERYLNATSEAKTSLNEGLSGLEGWFGTTSKVRKEIIDNTEAITDVASSIIEENIGLVVNKTGQEAYNGLIEIQNRVRRGLKNSGLSESAIDFILNKGYISAAIKNYRIAAEEHERYNQKIKGYYDAATKATQSTMTFTEKVNANARALRNNTDDAISLYNRVYDIVKIAQQNHTINFDLKLTAEKPPKWMLDKSLPELQQLAERFTAIAQSGGRAKGYTNETTYQQGLLYASAARTKQEEEERKSRQKDKKTRTKQSDEIAKAIKEEISLVKELQGAYDTLTKKGDSHANAIAKVQDLYGKTIDLLNKDMDKFGLPKLDLSIIKGNNHNEVLAFFEKLRDVLESKGLSNLERMEAVEGVVKEFRLKADTYNLDMITKGLNNELGKLKDEYELAVELDADPELGNAFANMMGIDIESLPHTVKEYADRYSTYLNKYLKGKNSSLQFTGDELRGLTRDDITAFREQVDAGSFNQEWFDAILKAYEDINGKRKKDLEETEKWKNSLIEKYGNLQDKLTKIYKDSVQNQVNAVKTFGTEDQKSEIVRLQLRLEATDNPAELVEINKDIAKIVKDVTDKNPIALKLVNASANQTKADVSKAYWEDFKNNDELYAMTFEDMANNSTRAIQLIMDKLEGLKDKVKEDPASMKALMKSFEDAEKELNTRDPFGGIARSIKEWADASREAEVAQKELWEAEVDVEQAQQKVNDSEGGSPEEQKAAQDALTQAVQRRANAQVKLTQAENKGKKAQENLKNSLQGMTQQLGNIQKFFGIVSSLFRAGGDDETADAIDAINEGFTVMTQVIMGVMAAMVILESSNPWLLAIAAALSVIVGLVSFLIGNDDKKIVEQIEESERAVKRLENTYKNLSHTAEEAYGAMVSGAKKAMQSNKELQLVELKRQLALEKSRDSKHRDEDKIADLEGQIIDLKNEIHDATQDIINDLLDISSAGDGIESLVSVMIDAFRNGEDAMEAFGKEWDKMIDNMILKLIVTQFMKQAWDTVMDNLKKKQEEFLNNPSQAVADAQKEVDRLSTMSDAELALEIAQKNGTFDLWGWMTKGKEGVGVTNNMIENYKKAAQDALTTATEVLNGQSLDYTKWSLDYMNHEGRDYMTQYAEMLKNSLGDWYTYGENNTKELSALQQGLQSMSESTAESLEAYMNSVSQQVYLHSDLLTQIRDAVVGFDIDVQTASLSQILLQLQTNYIVMQSMQSMMEGWTTPSGQGIRVELIS